MGRCITLLLIAGFGLSVVGCTDASRDSSPTSPSFATTVSCDLSTARSLVNSIFPMNERMTANSLLQIIQNEGSQSEAATNAGFDLLALVATYGPASPLNSSTFANAIIPCQNVGTVATAIDFTAALGPKGAFAVRGASATDGAPVLSQDRAWGLEPPLKEVGSTARYTWNEITNAPSGVTTKRFLAYGYPVTPDKFTTETPVSTIFDWYSIPTLTFSPGVIVGSCINDGTTSGALIQHNAFGSGGEIIPSATSSFCSFASASRDIEGWSLAAVAHRLFDLFKPQPLLAAALWTRPPAGSTGALSPYIAVNPGQITLAFLGQIADGKTGVPLTFKGNPPTPVSVSVTPAGFTPMDGVRVKLIATTNLGATVTPSGNIATTENGVATFPNLTINKAGGYRLIATLDGFGQNSTAGFQFNNVTSNGFNLKQSK
jgi:hypothetical protein